MNYYETENTKLVGQIREYLPLIEIERQAYIQAERGRLAAIIGTGYWDNSIGEHEIFHGKKGDDLAVIDDRLHDPYEITIGELYWITQQYKKIERCGTETYTLFFNMMPEDKKRIKFLSDIDSMLRHGKTIPAEAAKELVEGHDAFIDQKLSIPVRVIGNIEYSEAPQAALNGGYNFNNCF